MAHVDRVVLVLRDGPAGERVAEKCGVVGNVTTVGRWVAQRLPTRPTQHSSLVHFFHVDPVIKEMKPMHGEGVCKFIGAVAFMEWCDGHQLVEKIQSITPIKIKAETMIM